MVWRLDGFADVHDGRHVARQARKRAAGHADGCILLPSQSIRQGHESSSPSSPLTT